MGLVTSYATPSKWLKADDLENGEAVFTIATVGEDKFDDGRIQPVIHFEETEKQFGLNKTNREKLAEMFGSMVKGVLDVEPGDLIGQRVCLYRSKTQTSDGATVACIRIRQVRNVAPARDDAPPPGALEADAAPAPNALNIKINRLMRRAEDLGLNVGNPKRDNPTAWILSVEAQIAAAEKSADDADPFADE